MGIRPIDANALKQAILEERDKIPVEMVERYSFGVPTPYKHGEAMRGGLRKALRCMENTPTLDYEPVRHGEWGEEIEPNVVTASGRDVHLWRCSACGFSWANKHDVMSYYKYCPNCGAKMGKGDA